MNIIGLGKKQLDVTKLAPKRRRRVRVALLIPAHNEELVLHATIASSRAAGVLSQDIYLVDDSSTDKTYSVACELLGAANVLHVERSGKSLALKQAIDHFDLTRKYRWLQIIDADSIFSPNYFDEIRAYFAPDVAAVCGQVKSLENNWITSYRAYEYTVFQDFYKTLQAKVNLIGVMPGPATCFNTRILKNIDFSNDTLTEDFDMTIQVHHGNLGRICYAAYAWSWTQDPPTLPIYIKQINRWYTGYFQVVKKYKISRGFRPIDLMLVFFTIDGFFYALQLLVFTMLAIFWPNRVDVPVLFAGDFLLIAILATYASFRMKRLDLLLPLPTYYVLRLICVGMYLWAAIKVYLLSQKTEGGVWNTKRIEQDITNETLMEGGVTL
jgi:cellulose synthase/poly-beta-1,6-N-acetylglucosamine synthase-like glycosyltransferase